MGAQDTPNDSKLAPQPDEGYDSKCNATTEGGGSKVFGAKVHPNLLKWLAAFCVLCLGAATSPWSPAPPNDQQQGGLYDNVVHKQEKQEGIACPPQWLPVLLASEDLPTPSSTPSPEISYQGTLDKILSIVTNLKDQMTDVKGQVADVKGQVAECLKESPPQQHIFTWRSPSKASLQTAVQAYNTNPTAAIATYGPIADWDVSAITDMSYLFSTVPLFDGSSAYDSSAYDDDVDESNFNADISSWDTSKVTNMLAMFREAYAFNQPLSFDTSSVTGMGGMFYHASAFNQPLSFDTSKVTDMGDMFHEASAFNQPLSFDTSRVTHMRQMFAEASAFNQPLSFDTSKVTNMRQMFIIAPAFNQELSFDMSSVTDKSNMFYGSSGKLI